MASNSGNLEVFARDDGQVYCRISSAQALASWDMSPDEAEAMGHKFIQKARAARELAQKGKPE